MARLIGAPMVASLGSMQWPKFVHVAIGLVSLSSVHVVSDYVPPTKYLLISNARSGTIGYAMLRRDGGDVGTVRTLIDTDLMHPQGLAVDQKRQLLLIADSDLKKVVSYGLTVHEDGSLAVDEQTPLAEDVEARWVAVDGLGNVYITDEIGDRVLKVTAQQVLDGDTKAHPVFAADSSAKAAISAPGGIATDNFFLYWTNKVEDETHGTVVRALGSAPNQTEVPVKATIMAKNAAKAYGACLALDNLYYTAHDKEVYAVKSRGGNPVTVSSEMKSPRGCAWDGESYVYVADRSADGVYAVPLPSLALAAVDAKKVAHFEGAFGLAVFSAATPTWRCSVWVVTLLLAASMVNVAS